MNPKVENLTEEDGVLSFTIYNVDVCFVNALRRTILSDIPVIGFKTTPNSSNNTKIQINTTRLNNEIIKHRLSCIPVCISDINFPVKNYIVELDVENNTDTIMFVTSKDFKIKDLTTDKYLDENTRQKIFPSYIPPNGKGEYYIDFLRLRPRISDELQGERIKLVSELSVVTARDDSVYNVSSTCSYGCTLDNERIKEELQIRKQKWKDEGKNDTEINFESKNWSLLEGMRYVKSNSFDFILESIGIYENNEIITKACDILLNKLEKISELIEKDELPIKPSDNTLENCYDVTLINEDYTIGNMLNYVLYSEFYKSLKFLDYVGFKKMHPHDSDSLLRISLTDKTKSINTVKQVLTKVIEECTKCLLSIKTTFEK
jgi:DNA-directed RNA polymerase subunit L